MCKIWDNIPLAGQQERELCRQPVCERLGEHFPIGNRERECEQPGGRNGGLFLLTSRRGNKANSKVQVMREYFPLLTTRRGNKANSKEQNNRKYFPLLTSRRGNKANSQVQRKSENISSCKECEHWSKQSFSSPFDSRR